MDYNQSIKVKVLYCIYKDSIRNGKLKKQENSYEINKRYILRDREIDKYIRSYMDKQELIYIDDFSNNVKEDEKNLIKEWFDLVNQEVDTGQITLFDLQNVPKLLRKIYE